MSFRSEKIKVYEMTCTSCENRIEKAIKNLAGVKDAKASYSGQYARVTYDDRLCSLSRIKAAIENAGYSTKGSSDYKFMGILIIAAVVAILGLRTSGFDMEAKLANASYLVLFVVGLLTSIHCVGMCGGILLSQSLSNEDKGKFKAVQPALLYNLGRVISYTILGGLIGALGSVFSLSITAKATMQLIAGLFMIMMGFNMAGFSAFRKLQIKLPHFACKTKNKSGSPFIVGLLNGLMPCGPLQTMQLFALGTGSMAKGALAMFVFSLGTVPLMLTFGALSGLLSQGYTKKILKFSGVLIIILGLIMGSRGLALAGIDINPVSALSDTSKNTSSPNVAKATLQNGVQIINMTADNNGYTPNAFYVEKGIPVKWIIDGKELNSCNNSIVARELKLEWKLKKGQNIQEFTPGDKDINFSCWMGMIRGVIKVVDRLDSVDTSKADSSLPPPGRSSSCCVFSLGGGASAASQSGIFGNDITKALNETIINKATVDGRNQTLSFKGIGDKLTPKIAVTSISEKTKLSFDLKDFDEAEDDYFIIGIVSGRQALSFTGKKGITEVDFSPKEVGGYAIIKGRSIIGIIEVVDDLKSADLGKIKSLYLP